MQNFAKSLTHNLHSAVAIALATITYLSAAPLHADDGPTLPGVESIFAGGV